MKLRPEFEIKCLKAVINNLHEEITSGVDIGKNSQNILSGDIWIDVRDEEDDALYSINYWWEWDDDGKGIRVAAYPTEEYIDKKDGQTYVRDLCSGDYVIILGDDDD